MTSPQGPSNNTDKGPNEPSRNVGGGGGLPPNLPDPVIEPRSRWIPSLVWVIPLIAALIGIALVVKSVSGRGPTITISFVSAEGLETGKTKLKYKDVDVGTVKQITLSKDHARVLVDVQLTKVAEDFAVKDTRFWVVRPRVAASGVTGLGTLLSGAYIGVDAGKSKEDETRFVGLETPPAVTGDQKGRQFTLRGESLGSIDIGSPIYYRRVQVGQVVGFSLDKDGTGVTMQVFVNAPYDQYVGTNSRWWHASGVDLRLDASGFKLNTQSLATVVLGGIAFQTPPNQEPGQQAPDNMTFRLGSDESDAMRDPDGQPIRVVMNFNQSLRGLSVGAPIDFRGITIGNVKSINLDYQPSTQTFPADVIATIYPQRLGRINERFFEAGKGRVNFIAVLGSLIDHGFRAQVHPASLFVRRDLVLALGGWMALPASEDTGLLLALNAVSRGWFSQEVGLLYRKWEGQATSQSSHIDPAEREAAGGILNPPLVDGRRIFYSCSGTAHKEALAGGHPERTAKTHRQIYTLTTPAYAAGEKLKPIERILFPQGNTDENQLNDVVL